VQGAQALRQKIFYGFLEPGVTTEDCFVRIVNTRLTGIGKTKDGGNQNIE